MTLLPPNESIAEIAETDLIRRLLAEPHWRERFFRIHGIPDRAIFFPEVLLTRLGAEGDVDILAVDPESPATATAIQVKRIKVSARTFETGRPNKLAAIPELQRQSTLLVNLGFHQVFSYVIVVVDSREKNFGEYTFEGLTSGLRSLVDNAMTTHGLHPDAGFIQFELCQPIDDVPLVTGTFCGRIHRMPKPQVQSARVTNFVRAVLAPSDATTKSLIRRSSIFRPAC